MAGLSEWQVYVPLERVVWLCSARLDHVSSPLDKICAGLIDRLWVGGFAYVALFYFAMAPPTIVRWLLS